MTRTADDARLTLVRLLHTLVWAFMVACIVAIPVFASRGRFDLALVCIGIVLIETLILLANGWRCPLTDVAARYTTDRTPGFDIFLPRWLARNNKLIFGTIFAVCVVYAAGRWWISG